jgi:hypothetical protein
MKENTRGTRAIGTKILTDFLFCPHTRSHFCLKADGLCKEFEFVKYSEYKQIRRHVLPLGMLTNSGFNPTGHLLITNKVTGVSRYILDCTLGIIKPIDLIISISISKSLILLGIPR